MSTKRCSDNMFYCPPNKLSRQLKDKTISVRDGQCVSSPKDCDKEFNTIKSKTGYCTDNPARKGPECDQENMSSVVPQSATHHPKYPSASAVIASQAAIPSAAVAMTPQQMASSRLSTAVVLQNTASKVPMTPKTQMAMKELEDAMDKLRIAIQPETSFSVPYTPSRRVDLAAQAAGSDMLIRPVTRSVTFAHPSKEAEYTPLDVRFKARPTEPDQTKGKIQKRSHRRYIKKNKKSC
jgi:hypothetical protein